MSSFVSILSWGKGRKQALQIINLGALYREQTQSNVEHALIYKSGKLKVAATSLFQLDIYFLTRVQAGINADCSYKKAGPVSYMWSQGWATVGF